MGLGASQIPVNARLPEGSDLRKARSVLALTAAPKSLPCREAERDTISSFVQEAVQAGEPLCQFCSQHFFQCKFRSLALESIMPLTPLQH